MLDKNKKYNIITLHTGGLYVASCKICPHFTCLWFSYDKILGVYYGY